MKALFHLLFAVLLTSCAALDHSAQAPRPARHRYHHQQRRHQHLRSRAEHPSLPWN